MPEDSAISSDVDQQGEGQAAAKLGVRDLANPFALLATCFGIGLIRVAPGTFASIAAAIVWWFLFAGLTWPLRLAGVAIATAVGLATIHFLNRHRRQGDNPAIVIDELAGCWLALALCPRSIFWATIGVALFRAFDVVKPWPVSWADTNVPGALGVMLDDLLAGAFAAALLYGAWAAMLFAL
ncbi:MAG: phosphatidylglycerophosphatase A [Gammaproteobacteria bacterium]|nr:phosphatidylglycerophosphatase A [Gammaproteobacteria bacterium]